MESCQSGAVRTGVRDGLEENECIHHAVVEIPAKVVL